MNFLGSKARQFVSGNRSSLIHLTYFRLEFSFIFDLYGKSPMIWKQIDIEIENDLLRNSDWKWWNVVKQQNNHWKEGNLKRDWNKLFSLFNAYFEDSIEINSQKKRTTCLSMQRVESFPEVLCLENIYICAYTEIMFVSNSECLCQHSPFSTFCSTATCVSFRIFLYMIILYILTIIKYIN